MSDNNLPPHLEAGAMVRVCNNDGKVIRLIRKADLDRMEHQLAAAERIAATAGDYLLSWEDDEELAEKLHKALADYANAKEPQ